MPLSLRLFNALFLCTARLLAPALLIAALLVLGAAPARAQLADGADKFFGAIGKGTDEARPDADFGTYFNQLTVENAGKWKYPEPERDQMNWAALDYWYSYAQDQGFPFRQHTFVWDIQQPDWIDGLSPAEQRAEVEEWISLYFQRYPETDFVDVVNEPIAQPASYRDALGGSGETGWDWVIWVFEKAKQYRDQYAPEAKLFLNEFSILKNGNKRATYLNIVALLQERGLIDGVGVQGHWLEGTGAAAVEAALDEVAQTGLPIHVTELDLSFSDDQAQLEKYQALFPVLWEHPAVEGVTLWGYKEGSIWRDNAYLVRSDGTERPALEWLRDYLGSGGVRDAFARTQAESHDAQQGLRTWSTGFGYFDTGDWARYDNVDFGEGAGSITIRLAVPSSFAGKQIELRSGSPSGTLLGALTPSGTGGWNSYEEQTAALSNGGAATGVQTLYLVGAGGGNAIANVDWFSFAPPRGSEVAVYATGKSGQEQMQLRIGGEDVAGWTVSTSSSAYHYTASSPVVASEVEVAFTNDDGSTTRDLRVDRIEIDGAVYESESATTYSTGTWSRGDGCAGGYKTSEWLHCNGAFAYDAEGMAPAQPLAASAKQPAARPKAFALEGTFPNPTRGTATVRYALPEQAQVTLAVYDVLGRRVGMLAEAETQPAGYHRARFEAGSLASGTYFVRLSAVTVRNGHGHTHAQKLVLVR